MEEVKFKYKGKPYTVSLEGGWAPIGSDEEVEAYGRWIQEKFAHTRNLDDSKKRPRFTIEDERDDEDDDDDESDGKESDWYESLPTAEARSEYFLTTQDLAALPYKNDYNGFASGRATKFYRLKDLEKAAIRKHGSEKLAKKRAHRAKREERQQQKVLAAAKAEEEFLKAQQENGAENCAIPIPAVPVQTLESIRTQVRRAFQPCMTWEYLDSRLCPRGCHAVVQVPGVGRAEYAALIGRPHDPQLVTLVKTGAWYSARVSYNLFFPSSEPMFGKNSILGVDTDCELIVKLKPASNILSVKAYVKPMGSETSKRIKFS